MKENLCIFLFLSADIDECSTQTDQCVHATCVDNDGGYTCNCETGYQAKVGSDYVCEGKVVI